jgi:four helix bundle protein
MERCLQFRHAMNQWREEMKDRTHVFAVAVLDLVKTIADRADTRRLKDQLVGAASGVDLNWHAACRARTHKEFTARLGTVLEEADESEECLALLDDAQLADGARLRPLRAEATELRAIFAKATRTANENERRSNEIGRKPGERQKGRRAERQEG